MGKFKKEIEFHKKKLHDSFVTRKKQDNWFKCLPSLYKYRMWFNYKGMIEKSIVERCYKTRNVYQTFNHIFVSILSKQEAMNSTKIQLIVKLKFQTSTC